ncbi:MAG TPA: permease prefix domain 2-containing transporter [Bryobacteraceae bacterium]|jgi:putative effector of murein hydrolase LrgA (UPF0299 family)|nr:permease prefix domain 2-containing transporter [Bryobacteraceae bacterium]
MTSQPASIHPPRIAAWLVALFTCPEETEVILGDLHEEFSQLLSKLGIAAARNWYWRQSVRTSADLVGAGIRTAPWSTAAAVAAGFLLTRLLRFYQPAMTAVLDRFHVYEHHPAAYIFCLSYGILMGHVAFAALVGVIVAIAAKRREMITTMALSLISGTLTAAGFLLMMARDVHFWFWMLPWSFASPIATVVGGVIVRKGRSAATRRGAS